MRRRELFGVGARLSWAGGREGRARSAVTVVALALVWPVVMAVCAVPGMAQARADRAAGQAVDPMPTRSTDGRVAVRTESWGQSKITLVFVAPGAESGPPAGVEHLPAVGRAVVSPALARILEDPSAAGLRARVGTTTGIIGDEGLVSPSDLRAYIGYDRGLLDAAAKAQPPLPNAPGGAFGRFGIPPSDVYATSAPWTVGLLLLMAAPMIGLLVACLRLSATVRDRQLASLRLLGLTRRDTGYVLVGTLLGRLTAGMVIGTGLFAIGRAQLAHRGLGGRTWFRSDVGVSWISVAAALTIVWGLLALARNRSAAAVRSPLASRVDRPPAPTPARALLPLAGGLGVFVLVLSAGSSRVVTDDLQVGTRAFIAHVVGSGLTAFGLIAAAPVLARSAGRLAAARSERVGTQIAGRVIAATSYSTMYATFGVGLVLLAVFASKAIKFKA